MNDLQEWFNSIYEDREDLEEPFSSILDENLWDLYETEDEEWDSLD